MKIKFGKNIESGLRSLLCFLAVGILTSSVLSVRAQSSNADKVKESMQAMKADATKMGEPKVEGASLFFGTTKINGNYTIVDSLKTRFNCTATFFSKKGTDYIRVSTSVLNEGNRAVGTVLDPKGSAYAAVSKGEAYYGTVDILGKKYEAGYEPIKNAAGEVVGVYYVGFLIE